MNYRIFQCIEAVETACFDMATSLVCEIKGKSYGWLFSLLFTWCVEVTCCCVHICAVYSIWTFYPFPTSNYVLNSFDWATMFFWDLCVISLSSHHIPWQLFSSDFLYICFLTVLFYCSVWFSYLINIFAKDFAFLNYFLTHFLNIWRYFVYSIKLSMQELRFLLHPNPILIYIYVPSYRFRPHKTRYPKRRKFKIYTNSLEICSIIKDNQRLSKKDIMATPITDY